MARVITSDEDAKSTQDTSIFKVRYRYAPEHLSDNSRIFCRKMIGAKKVYRKEDIIKANNRVVNEGWGPRGANKYNIWFYKGGGNCKHYWERRIYLKKNNERISVTQAQRELMKLGITERKNARWVTNEKEVARLPHDMPNNGFLKPQR